MKIVFWNIGKDLSDKKLNLISESIVAETPDIFCIAEGTWTKVNCQKIINIFNTHEYNCYYSPLSYEKEELKLNYKFKRNGLKIFVRSGITLKEPFSFSQQRYDGRIVALKITIDFLKPTILIFIHNLAKAGNREVTDDQKCFIMELKTFVELLQIAKKEVNLTDIPQEKEILQEKERIIIIGDFNLEPWDSPLRQEIFLDTSFITNHNKIRQRRNSASISYFNPIVELVFQTKIENLGGTYYNKTHGWALLDFVLYETNRANISYDIMTEFKGGSKLLNSDTNIKDIFLNYDLDHLPIITKINS